MTIKPDLGDQADEIYSLRGDVLRLREQGAEQTDEIGRLQAALAMIEGQGTVAALVSAMATVYRLKEERDELKREMEELKQQRAQSSDNWERLYRSLDGHTEEHRQDRATIARLQSELGRLRYVHTNSINLAERTAAMVEDFRNGMSYRELALAYCLSHSRARDIILTAAQKQTGLLNNMPHFPEALRRRFYGEPEPICPEDTFGDDIKAWSAAMDEYRRAQASLPKAARPSANPAP